MVIDFRCERCGKLLRAPEEASGRQSRCPECGNIQTVPSSSTAAAVAMPGAPAAAPPSDNPFVNQGTGAEYADPQNPYAAPVFDPRVASFASAAPITITRVDAGTVLSTSWAVFRNNMGLLVLGWFVAYLISFAVSILAAVPQTVAAAMGSGQSTLMAIQISANIVTNLFTLWVTIGLGIYFIKFARGQQGTLSNLFGASASQWVRFILASLVMLVAWSLAMGALAIPGAALLAVDTNAAVVGFVIAGLIALPIYLVLICAYFLLSFLVADRNPPVFESLGLLLSAARTNFVTAVLLLLVNLAVVILGFLALCVGLLIAVPFCYVIWTVAYLMMTGQPVGGTGRVYAPQPAY